MGETFAGLTPPYSTIVADPPWPMPEFRPAQLLTWCKPPMGVGFGGAFTTTTEFALFCRRGTLPHKERIDSSWWSWSRVYMGGHIAHSAKPDAFGDLVEQVSPGPYVELFCRRPRLGWDSWGKGYELPTDSDSAPHRDPDREPANSVHNGGSGHDDFGGNVA
jgi:hypothetical protein